MFVFCHNVEPLWLKLSTEGTVWSVALSLVVAGKEEIVEKHASVQFLLVMIKSAWLSSTFKNVAKELVWFVFRAWWLWRWGCGRGGLHPGLWGRPHGAGMNPFLSCKNHWSGLLWSPVSPPSDLLQPRGGGGHDQDPRRAVRWQEGLGAESGSCESSSPLQD